MNIWDSVQRGLEKATQEATRRARTQRLRSTIDSLTQQMQTQEDDLIVRTMEIFAAGQLTQSELLPLCQELVHLQQQLEQAQHELSVVQSQGQTQLPPTTNSSNTPTLPAYPTPPSTYQPYDQTMPAPPPPPPPGVTTISSFDTALIGTIGAEKQHCIHCHVELIPGDAYCHNCGTPIGNSEITQQPTMLVELPEEAKQPDSQAELPATKDQETPPDNLAKVEMNEPDSSIRSEENSRGV